MSFLEDIREDNENVFFAEFTEEIDLEFDNVIYHIPAIFDNSAAKKYNAKNIYSEIAEIDIVLLIEKNKLNFELFYNQSLKINGQYYTVEKFEIELGIYNIYLSKTVS